MVAGQKISVGIRPEFVHPDFKSTIEAEITCIESQGREILYDLTLIGGQVIRSIQSGERKGKLGDNIRWGIDADSVLFFDRRGDRI